MSDVDREAWVVEHDETVVFVPMVSIDDAVDAWLGDLARRGRSPRTRESYRRILDKFADRFPRQWDVAKVTTEDCEHFLDGWSNRANGTQAQVHAPLAGLFRWLYRTRRIKANPMEFVPTVTRSRPEDLDVLDVSPLDVPRLLEAARPWTEKNALYVLAGLGPRRHAVATLRLRDYDRRTVKIRFREKGSKTIWKPVPYELAKVLDASIADGAMRGGFQPADDPYLIPPEGPLVREGDRDDRVIWRVVKRVADRAGVEAHVHALRAAFACYYLLNNPGDSYGLQELLGHSSANTTKVYLRRFDRAVAMERVRTLAWIGNTKGSESPENAENQLSSLAGVGAGGFEPPSADSPIAARPGSQQSLEGLDDDLLERVREAVRPHFGELSPDAGEAWAQLAHDIAASKHGDLSIQEAAARLRGNSSTNHETGGS